MYVNQVMGMNREEDTSSEIGFSKSVTYNAAGEKTRF
jgi:hypothetical protein